MRIALAVTWVTFLAACDSPQPATPPTATATASPPASTESPATASAAAPPPVASAPAPTASAPAKPATATPAAGPRAFPPIDVVCTSDADCVMTSDDIVDTAPRSYACCGGCTNHVGNTTWKAAFDAACKANPPPSCPPIGCAMPIQHAVCVAKKCALKS
ncbi:hypothetical protein BH09MYX1_BH09MYX1_41260 [soil metagenome]